MEVPWLDDLGDGEIDEAARFLDHLCERSRTFPHAWEVCWMLRDSLLGGTGHAGAKRG